MTTKTETTRAGSSGATADHRPRRVQQSRRPGARIGPNARSVAAPTRWQNPHRPPDTTGLTHAEKLAAHIEAVAAFREHLRAQPDLVTDGRASLDDGRDLACYCPLDLPCHADVWLEVIAGAEP